MAVALSSKSRFSGNASAVPHAEHDGACDVDTAQRRRSALRIPLRYRCATKLAPLILLHNVSSCMQDLSTNSDSLTCTDSVVPVLGVAMATSSSRGGVREGLSSAELNRRGAPGITPANLERGQSSDASSHRRQDRVTW